MRLSVGLHVGSTLTLVAVEKVARSEYRSRDPEVHVVHARREVALGEARDVVSELQRGELRGSDVAWTVADTGPASGALVMVLREAERDGLLLVRARRGLSTPTVLDRQLSAVLAAYSSGRLFLSDRLPDAVRREVAREVASSRVGFTPRGRQRLEADPTRLNGTLHALALAAAHGMGEPRFRDPAGRLWGSYREALLHLGPRLGAMEVGTKP
jgi:hypothetical protein